MTEEKPTKTTKRNRGKRKGGAALGSYHSKLTVPEGLIPEDRVPRWINDTENRIQFALNDDWEFVHNDGGAYIGVGVEDQNTDIGSKISQVVGSDKQNNPMRAYLMMKWKDWHDADQAKKQDRNDEIDRAIKTPGFGAGEKGLANDSMYGKMNYKA